MMGDADIPFSSFSHMAGDSHGPAAKEQGREDLGSASTDLLPPDSLRKVVDDIKDHDPGSAKSPRGKSSRKKTQRREQNESVESGSGRTEVTGEQKAMFNGFVNLYVEYVLVKAMRVMVKDHVKRYSEVKGSNYDEPIFCATDESYVDIIDNEVKSTMTRDSNKESQNLISGETNDDVIMTEPHEDVELDEEILEGLRISTSPSQSDIAGKFELAAEQFLNTSIPKNDNDDGNDVFLGKLSPVRYTTSDYPLIDDFGESQCRRRRKYEFEVDCETGMITSREIVSDVEGDDDDIDNYDCLTEVDDYQPRLKIEQVHSLVEFGPDVESVFHVITHDDVDETITVTDENQVETNLARKLSSFRATSPTKLPRAIREQTDGHRRRCFSTGDTDRYKFLDDSSNEFYTDPDALDRIYTLPSPPRSYPNSDEHPESENEDDQRSSSQEELTQILDSHSPAYLEETNAGECQVMITTDGEVVYECTRSCNQRIEDSYDYQMASFNNNRRSSDHCREEQTTTVLGSSDGSGSSIEEIQLLTDEGCSHQVANDVAEVLQRAAGTRGIVIVPGNNGQDDDVERDLNKEPDVDEIIFESVRNQFYFIFHFL